MQPRCRAPRFENAANFTQNANDSVYGQVAAEGDNVYVVWEESVSGCNYDILFRKSQDGGNTFGGTVNISKNQGFSEHPQIAVSGSSIFVVWENRTVGNNEIFFAKGRMP